MKKTYLSNHTASTNSRTLANRHPWKDSHIASNPTILTNGNGSSHLRTLHAITHSWINGMRTREQAHVRPKQGPGPNRNGQAVNHDTVGVDEYIFADDHIEAIVCLDGWFNPGLVFEELIICHGVI